MELETGCHYLMLYGDCSIRIKWCLSLAMTMMKFCHIKCVRSAKTNSLGFVVVVSLYICFSFFSNNSVIFIQTLDTDKKSKERKRKSSASSFMSSLCIGRSPGKKVVPRHSMMCAWARRLQFPVPANLISSCVYSLYIVTMMQPCYFIQDGKSTQFSTLTSKHSVV